MVLKRKYIVNAIFLFFIIGSLIYLEKSTDKFEEELLQNGKFAIGTFEKFGYASKAGGTNYKYFYYNEDMGRIRYKVSNKNMYMLEDRNVLSGDRFLVLYNKDGDSFFFDKPIKDSTDFNRYVRKFDEMRKQKR